jgi:hypothetical protein
MAGLRGRLIAQFTDHVEAFVRHVVLGIVIVLCFASAAFADGREGSVRRWHLDWTGAASVSAWALPPLDFSTPSAGTVAPGALRRLDTRVSFASSQAPAQAVQVPFEYSDGYRTRAKIHRLASWASLPLFATEAVLGQQMFNDGTKATGARRSVHKWAGIGVVSLFGVNTATGLINMIQARKDPNGKTLRVIHATLMLVADAGFAATTLTAPRRDGDGLLIYDQKKNQHLALAYASISVATLGYLIMLFQ